MPDQNTEHRARDEAMPGTLQEMLLALLIFGAGGGSVVAGIARAEHFDGVYQEVAAAALDFRARYGRAPGRAHIEDLLAVRQPRGGSARVSRIIRQLEARASEVHPDYAAQRAREHVRRAAIKTALVEAGERYSGPLDGAVEDMEAVLYAALRVRTDVGDAGTFLSDTVRGLAFLDRTESGPFYALGIPVLDRMRVGMTPGEVILYLGAKNSGKCIADSELVLLPTGESKPIERVVADRDPYVLSFNECTRRFVKVRVDDWIVSGPQLVYRLTTRLGRTVRATASHPFLTETGWKPLSQLTSADRVAVPWSVPSLSRTRFPEHKLRVLGYLLSNGSLTNGVALSSMDDEIRRDFERCVNQFDCLVSEWNSSGCAWVVGRAGKNRYAQSNHVLIWIRELGLGVGSAKKFIPSFIETLCDDDITIFLSALFSCDLGISNHGKTIEYISASLSMGRSVQRLLMRLGVAARYRVRRLEPKSSGVTSKWRVGRDYARLTIGATQLEQFLNRIKFTGKKAREVLSVKHYRMRKWHHQRRMGDFALFDPVMDISPDGTVETFDLSVARHHNFIAGGVVVHNSWFAVHCGRQAVVQGARVVHVTLEMDEDRVAQRYYQTFLGIASRRDKYPMTVLEMDDLDRAVGYKTKPVSPRAAFADPRIREWIRGKIKPWGTRLGRMVIKRFPTGQLTVDGLRGYLDYLEHAHKFVPGVVIVDYPDLMRLPARDYRIEIGRTYVALRGLAVDRNVAMVLPTQGNRSSLDASTVRGGMVSEDKTKLDTADVVLTYSQTRPEHKRGLARLGLEYSRNSDRGHVIVMTQSYPTGQYVVQSMLQSGAYWDAIKGGDEGDGE